MQPQQQQLEKEKDSGRSSAVTKSTSDSSQPQHTGVADRSITEHALCALKAAKQSAAQLAQHLLRQSSLPFKLLAASWLLTNVLLPLLFLSHPLARATLVHAAAAVGGSVLLHYVLGPGPLVFASFLSLTPLLVPRMPAAFMEVDGRTIVLLPPLLFPRLLPLWRQLQLVVNTAVLGAVLDGLRQHVRLARRRKDGSDETSVKVDVPAAAGRQVGSGGWELDVKLRLKSRLAHRRDEEMDTESDAEAEAEGQQPQQQQQAEQKRHAEWSREQKREHEKEAEYPRAPPPSPADYPLKMRLAQKEEGGTKHAEARAAEQEEGRGEFQSPRPQSGAGAEWDVTGLRKALDPLAAEHQCFKQSSDTVAPPHGDPLVKAEQQQQQQPQQQQQQRLQQPAGKPQQKK